MMSPRCHQDVTKKSRRCHQHLLVTNIYVAKVALWNFKGRARPGSTKFKPIRKSCTNWDQSVPDLPVHEFLGTPTTNKNYKVFVQLGLKLGTTVKFVFDDDFKDLWRFILRTIKNSSYLRTFQNMKQRWKQDLNDVEFRLISDNEFGNSKYQS